MPTTYPITKDQFKSYFDRDFEFGTAKNTVRDQDIDQAIAEAYAAFNPGLWTAGVDLEIAFELWTAHCLVRRIGSAGGIDNTGRGVKSSGKAPISSKSAGPLSVSYTLPGDMADNPMLFQLLTTGYGMQYAQMLIPRIVGNVGVVAGATLP